MDGSRDQNRQRHKHVHYFVSVCKFARNNDPLRGDFVSNSDPS